MDRASLLIHRSESAREPSHGVLSTRVKMATGILLLLKYLCKRLNSMLSFINNLWGVYVHVDGVCGRLSTGTRMV